MFSLTQIFYTSKITNIEGLLKFVCVLMVDIVHELNKEQELHKLLKHMF